MLALDLSDIFNTIFTFQAKTFIVMLIMRSEGVFQVTSMLLLLISNEILVEFNFCFSFYYYWFIIFSDGGHLFHYLNEYPNI